MPNVITVQTTEVQQLTTPFEKANTDLVKPSTSRSYTTPFLQKTSKIQYQVDDQPPCYSTQNVRQTNVSSFAISPTEVKPPPVQQGLLQCSVKKFDKRRGKRIILTSSPYKEEFEVEKARKKNLKRVLFKDGDQKPVKIQKKGSQA